MIPHSDRTPVFGHRRTAVDACLLDLDGRQVSWFSLDGGKHRGAIGSAEGEAMERAVRMAIELGIPIVGRVASSGADVRVRLTPASADDAREIAPQFAATPVAPGSAPTRRAWYAYFAGRVTRREQSRETP